MTTTTTAPDSNTAVATQPATLEQVVEKNLWTLPIPMPKDMPEPGDAADYKTLHDAKLAAIAEKIKTLPAVTDEKTYDINQKALTALVKVRTGLDGARKAMFDSVKKLKDQVDAYVGTNKDSGLQARVKEIERGIEEKMQAYRDEIERKRQEAERVLEQRNNDRMAYILESGMNFDGHKYTLGELILWPVDLKNYGEPEWMSWLDKRLKPAVQAAAEAKAAEEAEFQRQQAEKEAEDKRIRELFEKQQADQKRMDEERAELDRQWAELRAQRNAMRLEELKGLGAEHQQEFGEYATWGTTDFEVRVDNLADQNDEQWSTLKATMRDAVVRKMERDKENLRRQELEDERSLLLRALSHHQYDGDSVWTLGDASVTDHQLRTFASDEWAACLARFERAEALEEENRQALGAPMHVEATEEEMPGTPVDAVQMNADAPPAIARPSINEQEVLRLEGMQIDLESLMDSAGSAIDQTTEGAHMDLYTRIDATCRKLRDEVLQTIKTYSDAYTGN